MKIVVVGTRGIKGIQGGVETHCENLYPRIAAMSHDVTIIRRSCYVNNQNKIKQYKGVTIKDIFAPRIKSIEAILHTFLAIIYARSLNPDILHIHAIGPSIMVPLAKLMGMKVVMTHHGSDYNRDKWGKIAKSILRLGEKYGVKYSDNIIVISNYIKNTIAALYGRNDSFLIFNGVEIQKKNNDTAYITSLGLESGKYLLGVGRFVKEKNFHQLIEAYMSVSHKDYKLVLAGDSDHEDDYSRDLKTLAIKNKVVLTGFIKGDKLNQIFSNAALFVLPSSHEGLPISLLEAMSYNVDVLVSDIPANTLPELDRKDFFKVGDMQSLKNALNIKIANIQSHRNYNLKNYDWDNIAKQVVEVYNKTISKA